MAMPGQHNLVAGFRAAHQFGQLRFGVSGQKFASKSRTSILTAQTIR